MTLLNLSWANLRDKALSSFLSTLLMALGVCLISLLLLLNTQLTEKFTKNIRGIDLVVGAKGSPLQLILSSVYQIDSPTGNISLDEANRFMRNPLVKRAIPMAMGDSYRTFRIVGTNEKYLTHFEAKIAQGRVFQQPLEAVVGARVAEATGLKLGDRFAGSHGFDDEGHVHGDQQYRVVGILDFNNSVVDQVIVTSVESVWKIHEGEEGGSTAADELVEAGPPGTGPDSAGTAAGAPDAPSQELTSLLLEFRNPMGNILIPRSINENTRMQAASPAVEINRLFDLLGVGVDTLRYLALAIIVIAAISVFVSLYNSLKERRYEMALMLSMGATRGRLFLLLLLEGLFIGLIGFVVGIVLSRLGFFALAQGVERSFHYDFRTFTLLPEEGLLLLATVGIAVLAAALPSLSIYRLDISRTLADE
jgi:putative ABC transport system permease protein